MSLEELKKLWNEFEDVPIDEDEYIDEDRYRRLDRTNLTDFCYLCTHETKRHIQRREFY